MRKMRLQKREIRDNQKIQELIEICRVVRVGAVDQEGMFIVPVNYGYDLTEREDGTLGWKIYFHSAKEGRKAEAFANNPNVALELDREGGVIKGDYTCSYSFAYQSIMGNGRLRKLETEEEKRRGLERIMEHLAPEADIEFEEEMLKAADVYCVEDISFTAKERKAK